MKIAVTGASGHVGANLCRMLIEKGHKVKALIHFDIRSLAGLDMELIHGDVTNQADLEELCQDCEVVFHLAAYISIHRKNPLCKEINTVSCNNLLEAAKSKGVRKIIHFSSIHAFNQKPYEEELNESRELNLKSLVSYDHSKAWAQMQMMRSSSKDLEIVVINPTAIVGPNDFKPSLLGNAIIRFYKGQLPGMVRGGYDIVDVRDVCKVAINAIDFGIGGECYLISGSWQSLKTVGLEIEKLGGHKIPRLLLPFWLAQIGAPFLNIKAQIKKKTPLYTSISLETLKNGHRNISSAKAKSILGHHPRPFSETISDTVKWFNDYNYL